MGLSKPIGVVSPHMMVTLPYAAAAILTESAAQLGDYRTFVLNNIFDPDFTGGGLQPLGLDQYAQFYGRYRVIRCRYEVTFASRTAGEPIIVGLHCSAQSTLPAVSIAWAVQPFKSNQFGLISGPTGGPSVKKLGGSAPISDVLGVTKNEYMTEMDFAAAIASSPARQAYLHLWIRSITGTVGTCHVFIRLFYDVEFSQPVALSLS